MIVIQISTNYLLNKSDSKRYNFLSEDFIKTLLFILIGIGIYWLVFKKIIRFDGSKSIKKYGFFYGTDNTYEK